MTTLAVTGHRGLPDDTMRLVEAALRAEVGRHGSLVGVSCLADGADQLFAEAVVDAEGSLVVVVPAEEYRDDLPDSCHKAYDRLLNEAIKVIRLDNVRSDSEAHMQASTVMLEEADRLIAVWDGQPARGYGGTADVVDLARRQGIPVTVIWPAGAHRD